MRFILASGSPRRRDLIRLFGLSFEIWPAGVDESQVMHPNPAVNAVRTARLKAEAVAAQVAEPAVVVGVDTIVALDGEVLDKPAGPEEARQTLRRLRGRTHQVHSGLALVEPASGRVVTDVATIGVPMRDYSDAEIEAYVATGDPLDKAGAYAIQHPEFRPVAALAGCYAGVIGLPLCHLARSLRALGVAVWPDIPAACQAHIAYDCPVFPEILPAEPWNIA